ncbi:MAG: DUF885 domain-containing protein [Novosphingobium sp.]|uniref:DUF885 domain-containing protein n=1 Tax=Novosphingobium sp. TaxID=1874826 RepID=UPI0032BA5A3E
MKFRPAMLALLAATAIAGCKPATPKLEFSAFTQSTIDGWLKHDPYFAVYQGAHQFDGKWADWSDAGLKARGDFLRGVIASAKAYEGLSDKDRFTRDYMVKAAEGQLFWLEEADQPHKNPAWYVGNFDPNVYLAREYADRPTRLKALIAFLQGVPGAAQQAQANLKGPLPASFIKFGSSAFGGYAEFYGGDMIKAFADVKDPDLQKQLADAASKASAAMAGLTAWLGGQEKDATQDFMLGEAKFARMLSASEAVDVPLAELERAGRADMARNQAALKQECDKFAPGKSVQYCMVKLNANLPEGGAVAEATRQIPELTAFVKAQNIVSIPGTEQALVRQSPPYNAQNGAYIDPPGPFEKGIPSIYYIAAPDPSWPAEKQRAYIPGKKDLLFTSVHEVMPGHFLQFVHANRSPSMFGRLFVGYAFAEGWAHYSEEMMWEAGYGAGDPETHIGQLSNALLRNCRYLSAIGLHTGKMTQEQSKQLFMAECFQDEGTAEQQAARGTYDPAYLNYTLGKLMIRKLRTDWTASRGDRAAWKDFHDTFLSYGGPPIPLVRQSMLGESEAKAAF